MFGSKKNYLQKKKNNLISLIQILILANFAQNFTKNLKFL
jgi:hypothetical protein